MVVVVTNFKVLPTQTFASPLLLNVALVCIDLSKLPRFTGSPLVEVSPAAPTSHHFHNSRMILV